MAETYLQLTQQIEELKQKAETIREEEIAGVIDRIKSAISAYGLTTDQLFGVSRQSKATRVPAKKAPSHKANGKSSGKAKGKANLKAPSAARFMDEAGNSWSGRGPRPGWIKAALAAGKSIDQFAVASSGATASATAAKPSAKSAGKSSAAAKFKDDAGNSWSGRGPRPRWFKAALESGKTPDQLAA